MHSYYQRRADDLPVNGERVELRITVQRFRCLNRLCSRRTVVEALRKGRTYGTILVDLESRAVVDLLPGRTSPSLSAWLAEHPGVQVIARDRSSEYATGATRGQ